MDKICLYCGKTYHIKPSQYNGSSYCSKACMAADYKIRMKGENNPNYRQSKDKICLGCGAVFHPNNNKQNYCSLECYANSDQKIINARKANDGRRRPKGHCKNCGVEIPAGRKMCDKCRLQSRRKGVCLCCGKPVASAYNVQYCKECRAAGLHKKEVYSICSKCGAKIVGKRDRKYCDFCWGQIVRIKRKYPRKKDANQNEIVNALEKYGCSVIDASAIGGGFPDLILGKNGVTLLFEIKNPKTHGKLNDLQQRFFEAWEGQADVVYTVEEALDIVDKLCNKEV